MTRPVTLGAPPSFAQPRRAHSRQTCSPEHSRFWRGFALLSLMLLLIHPARGEPEDWRLEKEADGVSFYLREHPGSPIPEFKAVTVIPASMGSVLAVLLDVENYSQWLYRCEQSFSIATVDAREQYIYQRNDLPWVRDRDIILRARLSHQDQGREVEIVLEAAPDFCQTNESANCSRIHQGRSIRIAEAEGSYRLNQLDDQSVEVVWEQHLNPGGKVPTWLVTALLSDIPMKSMSSLREAVQNAKYRHSRIIIEGDALRVETAAESS